jgi:hypothetical protein
MDLTTTVIVCTAVALALTVVLLGMVLIRRSDRRALESMRSEAGYETPAENLAASDPMRWNPPPTVGKIPDITTAQHRIGHPRITTDAPLRDRAAREGRPYRPGMYDRHDAPDVYVGWSPIASGYRADPAVDTPAREGHATHGHDGGSHSGHTPHDSGGSDSASSSGSGE